MNEVFDQETTDIYLELFFISSFNSSFPMVLIKNRPAKNEDIFFAVVGVHVIINDSGQEETIVMVYDPSKSRLGFRSYY